MSKQRHTDQHILLVEDDASVAEMVVLLLEGEGYCVTLASNAYDALHLLAPAQYTATAHWSQPLQGDDGIHPALIVLDLQLPGMGGVEFIRQATEAMSVLPPVIVLSAKHPVTVEAEATQVGAVGVLHKPFQIEALLELVERVLRDRG